MPFVSFKYGLLTGREIHKQVQIGVRLSSVIICLTGGTQRNFYMPIGTARLPTPKCFENERISRSKCIMDQNI